MTGSTMISLLRTLSCIGLAGVFSVAGITKVLAQERTADDFSNLGLPSPMVLARLVPVAELALAGSLLTLSAWAGVAAFGVLVVFTAVLASILRAGTGQACACFGATSRHPVGRRDLARNAVLLALAVFVAFT